MVLGMSEKERRVKWNKARGNALTQYEAELKSGDAKKEKDAIRKYLSTRIKTDFIDTWTSAPRSKRIKRRSFGDLLARAHAPAATGAQPQLPQQSLSEKKVPQATADTSSELPANGEKVCLDHKIVLSHIAWHIQII